MSFRTSLLVLSMIGPVFARTGLYARIVVQQRHYEAARSWLARFTLSLRALDALHLPLAEVEGLRLATADQDLSRSARNLGVAVMLVRA